MEDIEIDIADPVERCRRGRVVLGLEEGTRPDEHVEQTQASEVENDRARHLPQRPDLE